MEILKSLFLHIETFFDSFVNETSESALKTRFLSKFPFQCAMWDSLHQKIAADKALAEKEGRTYEFDVPEWLEKYIEYKFSLLDRTSKLRSKSFSSGHLRAGSGSLVSRDLLRLFHVTANAI